MQIGKPAVSGSLQSNDCLVRVYPAEAGIELELQSPVLAQFGKQIEQVIRATLAQLDIASCRLVLEDKGALDYTIRSRVETAVRRSYD